MQKYTNKTFTIQRLLGWFSFPNTWSQKKKTLDVELQPNLTLQSAWWRNGAAGWY